MESSLREYGPTPFPAYDLAVVTGMRAEQAAHLLGILDSAERAHLAQLLTDGAPLDAPEEDSSEDSPPTDAPDDSGLVTDDSPAAEAERSSRDQEMVRHNILQKIAAARRTRPGLAPRK
jgi:hypothetical protein